MDRLLDWLAPRWFAVSLLAIALLFGLGLLLSRRRRKSWSLPLLVFSAGFLSAAFGGLFMDHAIGMWVAVGASACLAVLFLWVVLTGQWSAPAAWDLAVVALFGVGGWCTAVEGSEGLEHVVTESALSILHGASLDVCFLGCRLLGYRFLHRIRSAANRG
jgi:hypothetical protein